MLSDFYRRKPTPLEKAQPPKITSLSSGHGYYEASCNNIQQQNNLYHQLYETNPWVHKCITTKAQTCSRKYKLIDPDGETETEASDNSQLILDFLSQPNPDDSFESLSFKIFQSLFVFGCSFVEVIYSDATLTKSLLSKSLNTFGNYFQQYTVDDVSTEPIGNGLPIYLRVLPTQTISVLADPKGTIIGYEQQTQNAKIIFNPDQIIHFVNPNSINTHYGSSSLKPLLDIVMLDNALYKRQHALVKNQSAVETIFSIPENATDEDIKKIFEQINQQYRAVDAKSNFLLTSADVKFTDVSKQREGEYLAQGQRNKEIICQSLNVPMSVVGETSGNSLASAGSDNALRQYINFLEPIAIYVAKKFNNTILKRYVAFGIDFELQYVLEDEDDAQDMQTSLIEALNVGILNRNEIRAKLDLDSIGEDGDKYTVLNTTISLESVIDPHAPPTPIITDQSSKPSNAKMSLNEALGSDSNPDNGSEPIQPPKPFQKASNAPLMANDDKKANLRALLRLIKEEMG